MGFTRLNWGFIRFYQVLSSFTDFYRVLLGFTGFYRVLPGFTGFYRVLPGFAGFYRALLGFTGFFWVLPRCRAKPSFMVCGGRHLRGRYAWLAPRYPDKPPH